MLRGGNEGLLIAFFGDLDEEQAAVAGRMRQRSGAAVAFVLDGDAWMRGPGGIRFSGGQVPVAERLRLLREGGLDGAAGDARRGARRPVACGRGPCRSRAAAVGGDGRAGDGGRGWA